MDLASNGNTSITQLLEKCVNNTDSLSQEETVDKKEEEVSLLQKEESILLKEEEKEETVAPEEKPSEAGEGEKLQEYVNNRGIWFTPIEDTPNMQPYGLNSVKELFR